MPKGIKIPHHEGFAGIKPLQKARWLSLSFLFKPTK